MNTRKGRLCIFGEVLFDRFPDGKQVLGGAPFNVAWHLQAFGRAPYFVSRIGADPEGDSVRESMRNWGMDLAGLQTDDTHPTGRVDVRITAGEPSYDIVHPCAYDAIAPPGDVPGGLLYHGSLALRDARSRAGFAAVSSDSGGAGRVVASVVRDRWGRFFRARRVPGARTTGMAPACSTERT